MLGIIGIFASLFTLMYFAYRGVTVLLLAPLMSLLACLFHSDAPLLATYTQVFMPAMGQFLIQYFPIFVLGAVFGRMMKDSGAADAIAFFISKRLGAHRCIMAIVLSCALLTYGGVSLFIVAFTIYPIAVPLFLKAGLSKKLIPGAIALGSFTFTMTALPGTPAIQNAIPMPVFGTTAFAAPGLGLIAASLMLGFGLLWLNWRAGHVVRDADEIEELDKNLIEENDVRVRSFQEQNSPRFLAAISPLLLVLVLNLFFSNILIPRLDFSYLNEARYGGISLDKVKGLWSLITALSLSLVFSFFIFRKTLVKKISTLNEGTMGSMLPILNTASEVGYGATIASLTSFKMIQNAVLGIMPEYPLVSLTVSVNALAGITGSASGGLSIALKALGDQYVQMALSTGVSLEAMHRVAAIACGGLDTLPHNGAVITLLAICKMNHQKSYFDIFMVAVVFPLLANIAIVILGSL